MSAPEISRKQAWCKLAILIAEGMPDPREIIFITPYDPASEYTSWQLDIVVDDAATLWRWAERLVAEVQDPRLYEHAKRWHQTAVCANWHGYYLTVKTYNASVLGELDGGMAAVRAIADETSRAGDSDAAPEASAIATTQPGDTNLPRGGEEVAGPVEGAGPATASEWTPGAGLERLKREMPHIVADLTDDDMRKADEVIAAAWPIALVVEWEG